MARTVVAAPMAGERTLRGGGAVARRLAGRTVLHAMALVLGFVLMVPFGWALIGSFKPVEEIRLLPPKLWPSKIMVTNYPEVWQSTLFTRWAENTVLITV